MLRPAAVALALAGTPAAACAVWEDFSVEHLAGAPVVLRATLGSYRTQGRVGLLDLEVIETLKGEVPDRLTIVWPPTMGWTPHDGWQHPRQVIVALRPEAGRLVLVAPMCSEAYLVSDTPEYRARLAAVLGQ